MLEFWHLFIEYAEPFVFLGACGWLAWIGVREFFVEFGAACRRDWDDR